MTDRDNVEEGAKDCLTTFGVHGISVVSLPGRTADEILEAIPACKVPHSQVRESTAGHIRDVGLDVHPSLWHGHATLVLPAPVTDEVWDKLSGAFAAKRANPVAKKKGA